MTVVPRSDRFGAFGTGLLLLPDGTLLCSCGRSDFQRGVCEQIVIASTDRGRTWGEPRVVRESPGLPQPMRGASLTRLADGRIAIVCNNFHAVPTGDGFALSWSRDRGATWTPPRQAAPKGSIEWCNPLIETHDGNLLAAFVNDFWQPEPGVYPAAAQIRSRDGGLTWGQPEVIASRKNLNLVEPSIVRLKDGRLMCLIRENTYVRYPAYKTFSEDDGRTWSPLRATPIIGHEFCPGSLHSGRLMVAYRHVGGYAATFAWVGAPDDETPFQPPATVRAAHPPRIADGVLKIRPSGDGETILYHLHPPECEDSTIELHADLRCLANRGNACGIHIAQAGWVAFHPDRVELPDSGGVSAPIDATRFHHYTILRNSTQMIVSADGADLLRTHDLLRGETVHNRGGHMRTLNAIAFGARGPLSGTSPGGGPTHADGEAHWRSVRLSITNPSHPPYEYQWSASSGKPPNWYEDERMIEIENNYGGSVYFVGQVGWVQFPDGEIFMVTGRSYLRPDGRRSSWLRGCYLHERDFPP